MMTRILVVDDEVSVRVTVREILLDAGYDVDTAEDAFEATEMLAAEDFGVVVTDIILPRMTGVTLLEAIKESSPDVQVILMTGQPTAETAAAGLRASAFDYLAKPIRRDRLLRSVANAASLWTVTCERRRLAEENQRYQEHLEELVKQRTAALVDSETRMELAVRGADLGTWDRDLETGHAIHNERFAEMLGYTLDELELHTSAWECSIHPDDRRRVQEAVRLHHEGRTDRFEIEHRLRHKSGAWIWVLDSGRVVERAADGKPLRACGTYRDITARKLAERELESRLRQQYAVATMGRLALAATDLGEVLEHAVVAGTEALGVDCFQVLELLPDGEQMLLCAGTGWHDGLVGVATVSTGAHSQAGYTLLRAGPVIVEDLRTERRFTGPALLHDHGIVSGMSVIIHGGEKPFGVLGAHTKTPRVFTQNDTDFLQAIANVISETIRSLRAGASRDRAREELEVQGHLLAATGRLAKVGGWEIDAETLELNWTDETFRIHELPLDEQPTAAGAINFYHPDDRPLVETVVQRALEAGESWDLEARLITAKGRRVWARIIGRATVRDGKTVKVSGVIQDITESRAVAVRATEVAARMRRLAVRLNEVREDERTALARELHDVLGQALTAINMDLTWMNGHLEGEDSVVSERVAAAAVLVADTIGVVRRMSGELRPPALDDLGLVEAVAGHCRSFARRAGLEITFELPDPLPELESSAATAVFRIVQESLTNVVRHAGASAVQVRMATADGAIDVRILDNGRGILPQEATGESSLGLLGMEERAAAFGGQLKVERRDSGGTEVILTMPLSLSAPLS